MAHLSLLKSVLYQLLEQNETFFEITAPIYREQPPIDRQEKGSWRIVELSRMLTAISESDSSVICIIDAMDEASDIESPQSDTKRGSRAGTILHILGKLVSDVKGSRIKFVVLSRPDPVIEMDFIHIQKRHPYTFRIVMDRENSEDIALVIRKGIHALRKAIHYYDSDFESDSEGSYEAVKYKGLPSARRGTPGTEENSLRNIKVYLQENAGGVILWVTLTLGQLETLAYDDLLSPPELERRAKLLPRKIDLLYAHIVQVLQGRLDEAGMRKARFALMLISGSASLGRPLRVREMWEALAIPVNGTASPRAGEDPVTSNRVSIRSWSAFWRHLRRTCGPLIEIVSGSQVDDNLTSKDRNHVDVGPEDIVQFMHRTVKDFLHSPDRTSILQFTEDVAVDEVARAVEIYLRIAFPHEQPTYGPQITRWKRESWQDNISEFVEYLEEKKLLHFALFVQSTQNPNRPPAVGYLSQATSFVLRNDQVTKNSPPFTFPPGLRRLYPSINTRIRDNDPHLDVIAITIGECFRYACNCGLVVATTNLLKIFEASDPDIHYTLLNGALLAAIQRNLLVEVRALTYLNRHQSSFVGVNRGWPIGRNADRRILDPFIQLALRSGSVSVVDYLFGQTDRFFARDNAVSEFAVTQRELASVSDGSDIEVLEIGSDASSVRSFDSVVLGLVVETEQINRVHRPGVVNHNFHFDFSESKEDAVVDSFIPRRLETGSWDFEDYKLPIVRRDEQHERQREHREFQKLYATCIDRARIIRDATHMDTSPRMDDIRDSLQLVIQRHVSPVKISLYMRHLTVNRDTRTYRTILTLQTMK